MGYDCDICRGAGKVRLPVYMRLRAVMVPDANLVMEESSREYPCPECADMTCLERVWAAREETHVASYIKEPGFLDHVRSGLARQLASHLLEHDYIKFERGPEDDQNIRFQMRATVGVVRPGQLGNLEERISERQTEVAKEVAEEAERQINNWGSHYGHADILKRDATRMVRDAIKAVLTKRAAWTPQPLRHGQPPG